MDKLLFLDIETNGLDPEKNAILEVGFILSDFEYLGEIYREKSLIAVDIANAQHGADDFVREMHQKSGLWEDLVDPRLYAGYVGSLGDVDAHLAALLRLLAPGEKVRLAGFSVASLDLPFVRLHMPATAALLSHRIFDCTTLRDALRAWNPRDEQKAEARHRVIEDCEYALNEARKFRALVRTAALRPTE